MIVIISACLRVAVVCMVGLFAVRDKVPGSVSNVPAPPPPPAPITDAIRYARGEIWWYQNRDDLALIDQKIDACRNIAANSTRYGRKFGCFVQRQKLGLKRLAVAAGKGFIGFFVDGYVEQRDDLKTNAIWATLKIITFVGLLVLGSATAFMNRRVIAEYCQNHFNALHDYIFPPSPVAPPATKEFQIYYSGLMGPVLADENDGARGGTASATAMTDPEPTVMMSRAEPVSVPLQRDVGSDEPGDGPCTGFGGNPAPSPRIMTQQWNAARSNAGGRTLDDELPTNDTNAAEPVYPDLGPDHDRIEEQPPSVLYRRSSSPEHVQHAEPVDSTMFSAPPTSQGLAGKKHVAFKDPIDRPTAPAAVTRSLPTGLPRRSPNVSPTRTVYDMSGRPTTLGQRAGPRLTAGGRVRPGSATESAGRRPSY